MSEQQGPLWSEGLDSTVVQTTRVTGLHGNFLATHIPTARQAGNLRPFAAGFYKCTCAWTLQEPHHEPEPCWLVPCKSALCSTVLYCTVLYCL